MAIFSRPDGLARWYVPLGFFYKESRMNAACATDVIARPDDGWELDPAGFDPDRFGKEGSRRKPVIGLVTFEPSDPSATVGKYVENLVRIYGLDVQVLPSMEQNIGLHIGCCCATLPKDKLFCLQPNRVTLSRSRFMVNDELCWSAVRKTALQIIPFLMGDIKVLPKSPRAPIHVWHNWRLWDSRRTRLHVVLS